MRLGLRREPYAVWEARLHFLAWDSGSCSGTNTPRFTDGDSIIVRMQPGPKPPHKAMGTGHLDARWLRWFLSRDSKEGQDHSILNLKTLKKLEIVQTVPQVLLETRPEQIIYKQSVITTMYFAAPVTKARFPVTSIRGDQARLQQPAQFSPSVITAQELTETVWPRLTWGRGKEQKKTLLFSTIFLSNRNLKYITGSNLN